MHHFYRGATVTIQHQEQMLWQRWEEAENSARMIGKPVMNLMIN
jgi:hypothetical protein